MIKYQLFIAVALLTGVAIGFFASDSGAKTKTAEPTVEVKEKKGISDKGEAATIAALRHEVAVLKARLAEREEQAAVSNEAVAVREEPRPRQSWRERMEEMKKNDPERYAQTTNRWEQWRRQRAERAQSSIDFLASVDASHMSPGAKKTHRALQDLIAKREAIEEQLHQEDLSDEEREKLWGELRNSHQELMRLNGEERRNLFEETAKGLGFEGQDVKEIAATIQDVIDATDGGFGPRHGRHGGGQRGHGGPGGR